MHPSHVPLLACAPLLLAGGCAPPEEAPGSMEIVQVVRDLLADPPEWEVVRSHPDLAPMVEVLSPALRFERDGADMPSLVLAPPGRVSFRIDPEDGSARLVAAQRRLFDQWPAAVREAVRGEALDAGGNYLRAVGRHQPRLPRGKGVGGRVFQGQPAMAPECAESHGDVGPEEAIPGGEESLRGCGAEGWLPADGG